MSCTTVQVVSGDTCTTLAAECGITGAEFDSYNSASDLCSTLAVGQYVCCSEGTLPDLSPSPYANGTCYTYLVEADDTCSQIAASYTLTVDEILNFNNETWGWLGCGADELLAGTNICLSDGTPPFPAPVEGTVCGPQVPNTTATSNVTGWADLNPCPLNACCDKWGQCGITPDFCTATESTTGNPGTAANGTNGCISNCGFEYGDGSEGDQWFSIGYFEAFNGGRPCLNMYPENIDTGNYTHIYFAFGNITSDFEIDISGAVGMFEGFVALSGVERVVSFGGWAFSTDPSTYMIFREGVTEDNRATLVKNIVDFVDEFDLDGVDFDWEYPGEPDIPGIPAGSDDDGANYLAFLKDLKAALPDTVTVSIAAPASYWYLKAFPIADIADVVDWIIYMTYDLHGVWDLGNDSAQPGCPGGNCLRSHVNLTETMYALSMITKAGVPSGQVMVGVASYGRSFTMNTAGCTSEDCTWSVGGDAGPCTDTVGYISNAEINQIISENPSAEQLYDDDSDTNILVYNDTQWVGYMTSSTKVERQTLYQMYSFGGSTEWAVDLESYSLDDDNGDGWEPISKQVGVNPEPICTNKNGSYWRCIECVNSSSSTIVNQLVQADKWTMSYTDEAVSDAISWYDSDPLDIPNSDSWTSTVAQYLGYDADYDCGQIGSDSTSCDTDFACSDSADDTMPLASLWILTTMARMRAFYSNWWTALQYSKSDLEDVSKTFKDTFAPDATETIGEEIADWILDQILGAMGSSIWSKGLSKIVDELVTESASEKAKELASDQWNDVWGVISDDVTDALAFSSTIPSLDDIESYIENLADAQQSAVNTSYQYLINGSTTSEARWQKSAGNGTWLTVGDGISMPDLVATITQQLLANVLIYAWNVTDYYVPVIVMTDTQDDTSNPFAMYADGDDPKELSDDDAEASRYSIPGSGKTFWLVGANACQDRCTNLKVCSGCLTPSTMFSALPGLTDLNGTSIWGGLTYQELIVSSYGGYVVNGNANGYDLQNSANGAYIVNSTGDTSTVPWSSGVETPGVFQVPLCDFTTAYVNQLYIYSSADFQSARCATYPCCTCAEMGMDDDCMDDV